MKIQNRKNNSNHGFTLVEMIVVLVIMAILAAILVPALLGYIDRAKEKQDVLNARNCMTAAQAELVELYSTNNGVIPGDSVVPDCPSSGNNNIDVDLTGKPFAQKILETADDDPYCFMIAMGSNLSDSHATEHDKYTVYYGLYMAEPDSDPLYYYNGAWSRNNPSNIGAYTGKNETTVNGRKIRLQYYVIKNAGGKSVDKYYGNDRNLWWWLKKTLGKDDEA